MLYERTISMIKLTEKIGKHVTEKIQE